MYFTSFRPKDERKYIIGEVHAIYLKDKLLFYAEIVDITHKYLHDVTDYEARIDVGYNAFSFRKIMQDFYKNENIDFEKRMVSRIEFKKLKNPADMSKTQQHSSEVTA